MAATAVLEALQAMAEHGPVDCDLVEAMVAYICANGTATQCTEAKSLCEQMGCDCGGTN